MKKICEITAEGLPAIEEVTNLAEGVCPVCQATVPSAATAPSAATVCISST